VPRIGEHTREVLAELGFDAAAIRRLLDAAIVFEPGG
jgi:crotonobetainyl-CoA:carnitine CoA-transferase CaiB-like acyl-CoA transferase